MDEPRRRPLPLTLAVLGVVAWVLVAPWVAPYVSLHGSLGPALSPLLWTLAGGYAVACGAGLRWGGPALLADVLAVVWMAWFGYVAYLAGGIAGVAVLVAMLPVLGAGGVAVRVGRRIPAEHHRAWAWAGVALCGPFVVLGPMLLRWLQDQASRGWPVPFQAMPEQLPFLRDTTLLEGALLWGSLMGVACLGRADLVGSPEPSAPKAR